MFVQKAVSCSMSSVVVRIISLCLSKKKLSAAVCPVLLSGYYHYSFSHFGRNREI